MKQKWIVVANRSGARIFNAQPFSLLKVLRNELGREKNRAMTTDQEPLTSENSPHEQAAVQFARRLARYLSREGSVHHFDELVVAAEPKMLGRIRAALSEDLIRACEWLKKDMVHLSNLDVGRDLGLVRIRN